MKQIHFLDDMIRAVSNEDKSVTRRPMKPQPFSDWRPDHYGDVHEKRDGVVINKVLGWGPSNADGDEAYKCPYGQPGSSLWVKEKHCFLGEHIVGFAADGAVMRFDPIEGELVSIPEDHTDNYRCRWRPAKFMPKRFCRHIIRAKNIRVEQLQDITHEECLREGMEYVGAAYLGNHTDLVRCFSEYWDKMYVASQFAWKNNPWVWVVDFEVEKISKS